MTIPNRRFLFILSITAIWIALCLFIYINAVRPGLPAGMTISGWKASGKSLTYDRLLQQLNERMADILKQRILLVDPGGNAGSAEVTLEQLGLQFDKQRLVDELDRVQHGSYFKRAVQRWRFRNKDMPLLYSFDRTTMQSTVEQTWNTLYSTVPINAERVITSEDQVQILPEKIAFRINTDQLAAMLELTFVGPLWSQGRLNGESEMPTFHLPLIFVQPSITTETLRAQGIERKLTEFTTYFAENDPGRTHNIRSTAESFQDMVLKPGEVFDYSKIIRQTEARVGYREAPVIVNGKIVPGIGGGICQVSTTLYNAILRAGLEVVERRNHSLPVSYIPLGQDATFSSDYINFQFRNNTAHHLLIRTETNENRITIKLFGTAPAHLTYEIESKIISETPAPEKFVTNKSLPIGQQQLILKGKPGYVVETYRYTKEQNVTIKTERISRDTYSPQPAIIAINTGEADNTRGEDGSGDQRPPQAPIVEDGLKGPVFR